MRITPIVPGSCPELASQEARIVAERGRVSSLYQVLLNSPPVAHGWEQLLSAVRNRNSLPAAVRELVILRVAVLNGASYEFEAHTPHALLAGLDGAAIEAVREARPENMRLDREHMLAIELTDAMTRDIVVPDALYAEAARAYAPQQLVDLLVTIAAYNMVSRFLVAAQIDH